MTDIKEDFNSFLENLERKIGISEAFANNVRQCWDMISKGDIRLPMVALTADQVRVQFAWSYEDLLLEIEVCSNGEIEWFAKDRITSQMGYGFIAEDSEISAELLSWLNRLQVNPI